MTKDRDDLFAWLLRSLVSCQQRSEQLGLGMLGSLLGAAIIETALQWDCDHPSLAKPGSQLDTLIKMKLRIAMASEPGGNVVTITPSTRGRK